MNHHLPNKLLLDHDTLAQVNDLTDTINSLISYLEERDSPKSAENELVNDSSVQKEKDKRYCECEKSQSCGSPCRCCQSCGREVPQPTPHSSDWEKNKEWLEHLAKANNILRSTHSIAERRGKSVNWDSFLKQVENELDREHKLLKPYWDEKTKSIPHEGTKKNECWEHSCSGCGHHDTMWKTLVSSPQWDAWYKYQSGDNQNYDVDECRELGIMSAGHFQAFIKSLLSSKEAELRETLAVEIQCINTTGKSGNTILIEVAQLLTNLKERI